MEVPTFPGDVPLAGDASTRSLTSPAPTASESEGKGIACAVLSAWWSFAGHGSANEADLAASDALLG